MDPQELMAKLLAMDPRMSPDMARNLAAKMAAGAQPTTNAGYGTAPNGYDVIDDRGGQVDAYTDQRNQMAQANAAGADAQHAAIDTAPQEPQGIVGRVRSFAEQHDAQLAQAQMLQQREHLGQLLKQQQMLQQRDRLGGLLQGQREQQAAKPVYSGTPPTMIGGNDATTAKRVPNMPDATKQRVWKMNGHEGNAPLQADAVSSADPRTRRQPDIKQQRIARYHELMAAQYSGKAISPAEKQWLSQVHAQGTE